MRRQVIINRRGGAQVGVIFTEAGIKQKVSAIDADQLTLGRALSAKSKAITAESKAKIAKGECTGAVGPSGYSDCLDDTGRKVLEIYVAFNQFSFDWNAYKAAGITIGNSGLLDDYADRLASLREDYVAATGEKLAVTPGSQGEAGAGGDNALGTGVKWLGIGFAAYVLMAYVAPPLLGAAATSRRSYRDLREA